MSVHGRCSRIAQTEMLLDVLPKHDTRCPSVPFTLLTSSGLVLDQVASAMAVTHGPTCSVLEK